MTFKACLKSMRLRTIPLSLSGIITGIALSSTVVPVRWGVVTALMLTAALLQVLSNLSNELGDTLHGTDTDARAGIHYSIQDGEMTVPQMQMLIAVIALLCCLSGLVMILLSFKALFALEPILLIILGAAAIWAAMHYTLGSNPYGYRALGDIFVFIFFGLVSTLGGAYVCSHTIQPLWVLPAGAIGCFSVGVLNVNNIRDMKTDAATRSTVAIKMGSHKARVYHTELICAGWLLLAVFTILGYSGRVPEFNAHLGWVYALTLPLFGLHLRGVWKLRDRQLDPMLPLLVMSTFATSILFALGLMIK